MFCHGISNRCRGDVVQLPKEVRLGNITRMLTKATDIQSAPSAPLVDPKHECMERESRPVASQRKCEQLCKCHVGYRRPDMRSHAGPLTLAQPTSSLSHPLSSIPLKSHRILLEISFLHHTTIPHPTAISRSIRRASDCSEMDRGMMRGMADWS